MGIGTQAWPGINFNKVQFFRTNVSDEPDRPQVLINAVIVKVESGAKPGRALVRFRVRELATLFTKQLSPQFTEYAAALP